MVMHDRVMEKLAINMIVYCRWKRIHTECTCTLGEPLCYGYNYHACNDACDRGLLRWLFQLKFHTLLGCTACR